MLKKLSPLLLFCAALFQVLYNSEFIKTISKNRLRFTDYMVFTEEFRSFVLFFSLLVLFGVVFLISYPAANWKISGNKLWSLSFLGILLFTGASVAYINPQGYFPWNKHVNYIELEVRSRKPDLYKNLDRTPDLILLGSSVSFLVPTDYFKENWGITGFNMSVNGGTPADFVNLMATIKRISPDSKMPAIVMVEVLKPGLAADSLDETPIQYIPDMSSIDQQISVLWVTIKNTLRLDAVSDSLFMFFIVDKGRLNITATLDDNGTMIESKEDVKDKQYRKLVEKNIILLDDLQSCTSLNEDGKLAIEKLVQLSHQYKFSLLIYRAPINQDFYTLSNFEPSKYSGCAQLFNEYMEGIAAQNPNVFFKDLSQYKEIATGGKELYRDTHHLTAEGNVLLLDALHNEIKAAIQWAQKNH